MAIWALRRRRAAALAYFRSVEPAANVHNVCHSFVVLCSFLSAIPHIPLLGNVALPCMRRLAHSLSSTVHLPRYHLERSPNQRIFQPSVFSSRIVECLVGVCCVGTSRAFQVSYRNVKPVCTKDLPKANVCVQTVCSARSLLLFRHPGWIMHSLCRLSGSFVGKVFHGLTCSKCRHSYCRKSVIFVT